MKAETLMIGTELLLGQIQDTNATWMAQTLAAHGIHLYQKTTVGDNPDRIRAALEAALSRADTVLCSGGLGPTEDDITRECVAAVFGRPLVYHEELFERVLARFAHLQMKITDNNKRQAYIPEGALVLDNPNGTAPGFLVDDRRGLAACMPGVPWELKPMMEAHVIPYLRGKFGLSGVLHYRVLKVCAMGESRVDAAIGDLITQGSNPTIGLLAGPDAVRIRIAAHAGSVEAARELIAPVEAAVRERLPGLVMGVDDETLEGVVDRLLAERGWTLAVADAVTGGTVTERLTGAGARQFAGARILPGVAEASETTALDVAQRLLVEFGAHCALVLLGEPAVESVLALFVSPAGSATWAIGRHPDPVRGRVRTAVVALEHIRRRLSGYAKES